MPQSIRANPVRLRLARHEDLPYIVRLLADDPLGATRETATVPLSRSGAKRAFIEGVRVSAAHRNQRIGELVVDDAIGRARAAGCVLVQLTTDVSRKRCAPLL